MSTWSLFPGIKFLLQRCQIIFFVNGKLSIEWRLRCGFLDNLNKVVGKDANFSIKFSSPPARVVQVFREDGDDLSPLQVQFIIVDF